MPWLRRRHREDYTALQPSASQQSGRRDSSSGYMGPSRWPSAERCQGKGCVTVLGCPSLVAVLRDFLRDLRGYEL